MYSIHPVNQTNVHLRTIQLHKLQYIYTHSTHSQTNRRDTATAGGWCWLPAVIYLARTETLHYLNYNVCLRWVSSFFARFFFGSMGHGGQAMQSVSFIERLCQLRPTTLLLFAILSFRMFALKFKKIFVLCWIFIPACSNCAL